MRRTFHTTTLLLMLLFVSSVSNASANALSDSSNITLQVVVSEATAMQHCNYNYVSEALSLSSKKDNNCGFSHKRLLKEANQLASQHSSYKSTMNIVMLTITAP